MFVSRGCRRVEEPAPTSYARRGFRHVSKNHGAECRWAHASEAALLHGGTKVEERKESWRKIRSGRTSEAQARISGDKEACLREI